MIAPERALRGRDSAMPVADRHAVLGTPMTGPFPDGFAQIVVGMGCFWGAERVFWEAPGVYTTAVGYSGGYTPNPSYKEVCSGSTGHTEAVLVVFDPYNARLTAKGYPEITTEIAKAGPFYYAEDGHQQYLHKNPWGYCGLGGTGVSCPVGLDAASAAGHGG
jgi:peptide-methionine (S)-S-oxide reductase